MTSAPFFTRDRLWMLGLLLLSALVYLPSLSGLPILDDHLIASGTAIGGGKSLLKCFTEPFLFHYFRPLVSASFWLEMRVHGATPFLLHQTNILIHILTTWLVVKLALECGATRPAAMLGGLFFALQPAQVGAVAWIGGRTDSQAALLLVLMLLSVVKFAKGGHWLWVLGGVLAGFLAMLTKEQVLPAILMAPLAGFAFAGDRRRALWGSAPYFAMGAIFFALWQLGSPDKVMGPTVTPPEVVSQISRSTVNYAMLFVTPNPWSMHTFSLESFRNPLWIGLGAAISLAVPYGIYRLWKYDSRLGWVAIGAALVYFPVSNVIPIPSLLAAPYRVAVAGPMVAILLGVLASKAKELKWAGGLAWAGAAASLVLVPWGAARHASESTLFQACVTYDPGSYYMRTNYLQALQREGRMSEALEQSKTVLDQVFEGHDWQDYAHVDDVFRQDPSIGRRVLKNLGARAEAGPMVSRFFVLHAQLLSKLDRDKEAVDALSAATRLDKQDDAAFAALGQLLLESRPDLATHCLKRAMAINPSNGSAIYALGKYYARVGDNEAAYRTLQRMLRVPHDTADPLLDLADIEIKTGRIQEAKQALFLASKKIVNIDRLSKLLEKAGA